MADGQLIDWHTHVWWPGQTTSEDSADGEAPAVFRHLASPESHRKAIAEGGADKFVVINAPMRAEKLISNDSVAEYVSQYPGRAVGFAAVDPNDPSAAEEFERSVTDLRLKGLKLSPVYQGFDPWNPQAWSLYQLADRYGVPVMFHMGGVYDPRGELEWGNPILLDRVGRAFPELRMIVAHFGQPHTQETVILMRKNRNVFTDLSARFHRRWQLYNALIVAIEYGVSDRILFGSDFPVMTTMEAVDAFRNINEWGEGVSLPPIPEDLIEQVIFDRPFDLLGF